MPPPLLLLQQQQQVLLPRLPLHTVRRGMEPGLRATGWTKRVRVRRAGAASTSVSRSKIPITVVSTLAIRIIACRGFGGQWGLDSEAISPDVPGPAAASATTWS